MLTRWLSIASISVCLAAAFLGCTPSETASPEDTAGMKEPMSDAAEGTGEPAQTAEPAELTRVYEVGDSALLEGLQPESWELSTPVEHYKVETMYNKIDGRSEMYMSYDVRELSWADYVKPEEPGRFVDVFVYDMQSASNAFGVFAAERDLDQIKVDLGRQGYTTDGNYYFWKGKYYAYVQSSHNDEAGNAAALHVAKGLDERLADSGEQVRGLDWLPQQGLNKDSITYFLVDAMSLDFMTDTFTARYDMGMDDEPNCFITRRDSPEAAATLFEEYKGYLNDYGMSTEELHEGDVTIELGDLGGGYYDGGFVIGDTVAGISAVKGHDEAVQAVKTFAKLVAAQ